MPATPRPESGNHQGPSPRWDLPENSCGDFITTLPDGKHVWITTGPVARTWPSLSDRIRHLVAQRDDFRRVGISFFIYMIGRNKTRAFPRIIFCSSDEAARKNLRNAVRESDILKDYPPIGLGDSSSPLARSDSGILTPLRVPSRSTRNPVFQPSHFRRAGKPTNQAGAHPSTHAGMRTTKGNNGSNRGSQDSALIRDIGSLSISDRHSDLSYDNSMYGTDSAYSRLSVVFSASGSTAKSSLDLDSEEQALSNAVTVKHDPSEAVGNLDSPDDFDSFSETDRSEEPAAFGSYRIPPQELGHIITELLRSYDSYRQLPSTATHNGSRQTGKAPQQDSLTTASGPSQPRKRRFQDVEEAPEEDDTVTATGGTRSERGSQADTVLACPFWKKDPRKYSRCFKFELKRVKDVKQHLRRSHKPLRCPRCHTVFNKKPGLDRHLRRDPPCSSEPEAEHSDISDDQDVALRRRHVTWTEARQWYAVWDIVFPACPWPSSPYRDLGLSRDLSEFREFFTRYGTEIALDYVRTNTNWTLDDGFDRDSLHQAFDGGLEAIYSRWVSERTIENHGESNSQSLTQQVSGASNSTPVDLSPSPDPGVELDEARGGALATTDGPPYLEQGPVYYSNQTDGFGGGRHLGLAQDYDPDLGLQFFPVGNHLDYGIVNPQSGIADGDDGMQHIVFAGRQI